jgi:hypothetical protein
MHELKCLAKFWGAEFYDVETEVKIHFEIGGWLNTTSLGLKTTLVDLDILWERVHLREEIAFAVQYCRRFLNPPTVRFKEKGLVSNRLYTGPAFKSDPRVQQFCVTDNDLVSFYKSLTTFERNYRKRIENFRRLVRPNYPKELREIQTLLLSTNPYYSIPDSMITYETRLSGSTRTFESELYMNDEDPITTLLRGEELHPDDKVFTWDPRSVPGISYVKLISSDWQFLSASQFSNSGFLPAYEYHQRMGMYPNTRMQGRIRVPPERDKVRAITGPQRHKVRLLPLDSEEIKPTDIFGEYIHEDFPIFNPDDYVNEESSGQKLKAAVADLTGATKDVSALDSAMSRLMDEMAGKYDHQNRSEARHTEILYESDEESLDLGMFDL